MSLLRKNMVVRIIGVILSLVILFLNFFMLSKLFRRRVWLLRVKKLQIRRVYRMRLVLKLLRMRLIIIYVKVVLKV